MDGCVEQNCFIHQYRTAQKLWNTFLCCYAPEYSEIYGFAANNGYSNATGNEIFYTLWLDGPNALYQNRFKVDVNSVPSTWSFDVLGIMHVLLSVHGDTQVYRHTSDNDTH